MKPLKLVVDNKIPYIAGQAERLGCVRYIDGAAITADDVRDADALIIRTRTRCNSALLKGSNVQFVATATIGFDHIDTAFMAEANIRWTNCPGCNAPSVAQYVAHSLLLLEEAGKLRLNNCTVGIVGVGHVGRCVDEAVRKLGCRTLLCDPPRAEVEQSDAFVTLDAICRQADVVSFHTPLTHEGRHATWHLANATFFEQLQRQPVIVNSSRGEVVCTEALLQALEKGWVRAAVIDTWENEPHIHRDLLQKAFIATPHIAGYSADGKACGTRMALEAVAQHFGIQQTFDVQPPQLPADYAYYTEDPRDPLSPLRLYHPFRDSQALKAEPEKFEYLRGHYPLRRESMNR